MVSLLLKNDKDDTKAQTLKPDTLDAFLTAMDDPDDWRTLGPKAQKLTAEEVNMIQSIQANEYADASYDPYADYVDFFSGEVREIPLCLATEPKRRFTPSKWEAIKIHKLVKAIRKGLITLNLDAQKDAKRKRETMRVFDMWSGQPDPAHMAIKKRHISAPKMPPPLHSESYNPPAEYLLTPEERAEWEAKEAEDREINYVPAKYDALRKVPAYEGLIRERYGRCLDLYMCPRTIKDKIQMNPDDLLPVLPDPRDLRPFPTTVSISFVGEHKDRKIVGMSVDVSGRWLISADASGVVALWEVESGRCQERWQFDERIYAIEWNPVLCMFVLASGKSIFIIIPSSTHSDTLEKVKGMIVGGGGVEANQKSLLEWKFDFKHERGVVGSITMDSPVTCLRWHRRGDYLASLTPNSPTSSAHKLFIHQLSRKTSQTPLKKMPGQMVSIAFHPALPHLFMLTTKSVRVYDLVGKSPVKKLPSGFSMPASGLAVHGGGDNFVISGHEGKLAWFDLDYSLHAYRGITNHQGSIRSLALHLQHPLLASCGDDGRIQIIHAKVGDDLSTNTLIVPVKTIDTGVPLTCLVFHPSQPWLFAASSKGNLDLYV